MFRKFRKVLAGATSTAVVAGMVTAGMVATASPAAADFVIPGPNPPGGNYATSKDNPTLASKCGLNFGLVLDSSGSIGTTGIANLKLAANAFVDALVDTGSQVAVTSFSTTSPGSGGTNLAPTALTTANLTTIKNSYNGLSSNGWTNWEDGLFRMDQFKANWNTGKPDLMVFITDGNPNTTRTSTPGQYSDGAIAAVNPAIAIANSMKTDGTKMFGIAVGSNITLNPIRAITNTTAYNGGNFPTAGYVTTTDYAALAQQLKELAVDLCAPSLTITKQVKTPDNANFVPADGWSFDTTVTIPGATGNWVQPSVGAIAQNTASTKTATTANGGAVNFQWEPNGNFETNPVIVKEQLKGGYERDPQLICVAKNVLAGTQRNINATADANGNWNLGTIASREIVTCTAKNTLTRLKLAKTVSGGAATAGDFTLTATSPNAPSYSQPGNHNAFEPINGGVVYTLGETGPANYTGGTWSCTNGVQVQNGNQITVPKGTQTECTITNTRDLAKLAVVKKVDGGASVPADWKLSAVAAAPNNTRNIVDRAGNITTLADVFAGTEYTLSETGPGNYTAGNWVCTGTGVTQNGNKVTVAKNGEATCEITNTRNTGGLKLVKKVSGGGSVPADWTMTATGPTGSPSYSQPGNHNAFEPVWSNVDYTLGENPPAGQASNYDPSLWTCDNNITVTGGKIQVPANTNVTCEITNTRKTVKLKLTKVVSGGGSVPADWTMTATGPTGSPSYSQPGNHNTFEDVWANAEYTLGETAPAGQAGNYTAGTWTCDNNITVTAGKITIPAGSPNVTCEITNTRNTASLKLVKQVTGDNGDKSAGDWELTATAAKPLEGKNFTVKGDADTFKDVYSNTAYALSESGPFNYTAGNWVCTDKDGKPVSSTGDQVTVPNGGEVTCVITNTRDTAELKLVKTVEGDNKAQGPDDWMLSAAADAPLNDKNFSNKGGSGTFQTVYSGTMYTLSETGPGNYTASNWVCKDEAGASVPSPNGQIGLGKYQKVTCEITNTRDTAELKLVKEVEGGDQGPDTWTLSATAAAPLNDKNFSNLGGQGTFKSVYSAVDYTLGETGPGDYTASDWVCKDAQDATVSTTGGKVSLTKNAKVTCVLKNTRDLGELKLVKKVTGDNNAKGPNDWDLSAAAAKPLDGYNFTVKGGADEFKTVFSNTAYALSESGPGNYTASNWVCNNAKDEPVTVTDGSVKVGKSAKVTCVITNDRDTAKLKLVKQVEGGAAKADDWTLTAKAAKPLDDKNISTPGGSGTFETVYSGVDYTLAESGPANYTASGWECVSADVKQAQPQFVQQGDTVKLDKGEQVTCTIVNDRDLAQLKLVKQVSGGKAAADEFTLTAKAAAPENDRNISTPGGSGQFEAVYAGTQYTLAETGPVGYTPGEWVCLPANDVPDQVTAAQLQEALNNGDKITLDKGAKVTCTIINTRDVGSLTISKVFDAKSSSYAKAFDIDYKCGDDPKQTVSVKAGESATIDGIPTGTECTVSEAKPTDPPAGWSFSEPTYDPANGKVIVSEKGETVSVTVTNEILKPGIKIVKTASATQVNPGQTVTYTYTVTNTGDTALLNVEVKDDKCSPVTYQSGDTNGDSKLQTTETWIFTCSQAISVATTNTATATGTDKNGLKVTDQDTITVPVVSPAVAKKVCPIKVTVVKKVKKVGNRVLIKKIKTKKNTCVLLKPVVLCQPLGSAAAGETAFCDTKVTKRGRVTVNTKGYDAVRVKVIVRSKPKPGFREFWKPNTWRKSWILR